MCAAIFVDLFLGAKDDKPSRDFSAFEGIKSGSNFPPFDDNRSLPPHFQFQNTAGRHSSVVATAVLVPC